MLPVFILCGGKGTRLQNLVSDVPKPMAPINKVPFLSILLNYLSKQGIQNVVLCTGYRSNIIEKYFKNHKFKNIKITYSKEESPLGTGGSILNALNLIEEDEFLVINGDTFFEIDIQDFYQDRFKEKDVIVGVRTISGDNRYNFININDNLEIISIAPKQTQFEGLINGGVIRLNKSIFENQKIRNFSLENYLFSKISFFNTAVLISEGKFIDIGIPEDFLEAQNYLYDESKELE